MRRSQHLDRLAHLVVTFTLLVSAATTRPITAQEPPTPTPAPAPAPTAPPLPLLTLPAFTGYASPDPDAMRRGDDGTVVRCSGTLTFYVHLAQPGALTLRVERTTTVNARELRVLVAPTTAPNAPTNTDAPPGPLEHTATTDELGTFPITAAGFHRITLRTADGTPLRDLRALHLGGPAAANAHANTAERRNAASVHLGYPVPREHRDDVEWFYVELTPRTDPLWTYYMATGWHRGYFGMQVNAPTERRVLFSVWDAGDEAVDREKVDAKNRVQLVAKGDGVHAGDFGNEGTGGHSHLVHPWQLGGTFRFLMHARTDGDATIYSGWFWFAERAQWGLIASFRAPKDGKRLHGLYSFSENFHGGNGDAARDCEFGNGWIRTTKGEWQPLTTAHFTHDETGKDVRRDRWAGVRGDRFYLHHGDFTAAPDGAVKAYRAELRLPAPAGEHPRDAELPTPPQLPR